MTPPHRKAGFALCVAVSACPLVPGVLRAQLCPTSCNVPAEPSGGGGSEGPEEGLDVKDTALAAGGPGFSY